MLEKLIQLKRSPNVILLLGYIMLSLLITTIWFGSADLLIYTDTHFPFINLEKYLERTFTIPDTAYFPASYDIRHLILCTYALLFIPFTGLWSLQLASLMQRIMLFALLFFSFSSISYFLFCISKITRQKLSYTAIFITALLYGFNTYAAIIIWRPFTPYLFHYALFPLFASFSLRYFSSNRKKYLLALLLLSFFIFPSYTIAPSLIFDFAVIILLFLSTKHIFQKSLAQVIYTLMKISAGILLLSIPLILVTLSEPSLMYTQYSKITAITESPESLIGLIKYNSPNIIRALFYSGYPPLYTSHFSWYQNYTSYFELLLLAYVSWLITLGILTGIKRDNGHFLWFGFLVIWLVFLFMLTGSNNPLPEVKLWIFQIKFFDMLRSVYARFGEYVILSSLPFIYLGICKLVSLRKSKIYKRVVSIFLALLVLVPSLPILKADFLKAQNSTVPSDQARFPNSYLFLNKLNDQEGSTDYLYITIPSSSSVKSRLWNNGTDGYVGPDIFPFILNGASITDRKIRSNVLNFILHGKFEELQDILPVRYLILTFDHEFLSSIEKQILNNYLCIFKRELPLVYLDENLAVFKLPVNIQNDSSSWRIVVLDQRKASVASNIFSNSHYSIIYQNLPLDASYILPNYIGKVFNFAELNKMKINSTVNLKTTANSYWTCPIYIVLPKVTERLYLAAEFKPPEKNWNIYSGFWSAETLQWNYTLLTKSSSSNLSFVTDFANNKIIIEDNFSKKEFQIPAEWIEILNLRLGTPDKISQNLGGEIGIYAGRNLTEIAIIDDLLVEIYENNLLAIPSDVTVTELSSMRISPTLWKVSANTTEPFVLAFLEAYDPLWHAYINGEKIRSIPLYNVINSFWINQTGQLEITIEYEPQRWFYIGCAISLTTFLACTGYLTYTCTKNKNIPHKIKQKLKHLLAGNQK
jgi:hypothetical protein